MLQRARDLAQLVAGGARSGLEIEILQRIGDAHYALGEMSTSVSVYETAAARAEKTGMKSAQIAALARLAFPIWGAFAGIAPLRRSRSPRL